MSVGSISGGGANPYQLQWLNSQQNTSNPFNMVQGGGHHHHHHHGGGQGISGTSNSSNTFETLLSSLDGSNSTSGTSSSTTPSPTGTDSDSDNDSWNSLLSSNTSGNTIDNPDGTQSTISVLA